MFGFSYYLLLPLARGTNGNEYSSSAPLLPTPLASDTGDVGKGLDIVEKVIVGGYDSNGNKDPYMIVFVYKTGFKNSVDGKNFKPLRKNSKENHSPAVLCSHASNEAESMCSDSSDDTL